MSAPFLSIVTINYNNAAGLKKTIGSVRAQGFTDYEHIIVDGGSTDGSTDVIRDALSDADYARHVPWWCSEKDGGIYSAMNKGISHATGTLVATLNSGDSYVPGALCGLDAIAADNPGAVLYGAISKWRNDEFVGTVCFPASRLCEGMIPHPASFVPRALYGKYGLYDETFKSSGDWELFLRLFRGGERFVYINRIVADFEMGGMSEANASIVLHENERILKRYGLYKVSYRQRLRMMLSKTRRMIGL